MPFGTASHKLRKLVVFEMLNGRHFSPDCYRCGKRIQTVDELSIEHKSPWRTADEFWNIENIAFSHLRCNKPLRSAQMRANAKIGIAKRKIAPNGFAWCSLCRQFLPVDRFSRHRSRWNGLHSCCAECLRTYRPLPKKPKERAIRVCKICGSPNIVSQRLLCAEHWREHQRGIMRSRRIWKRSGIHEELVSKTSAA